MPKSPKPKTTKTTKKTNPKSADPGTPKKGQVFTTVFWRNKNEVSPFPYRATHIDGKRAPKVILADDSRIEPGKPCRVRVRNVGREKSKMRGMIIVDYLEPLLFDPDDEIYVDAEVGKTLQAFLESGLNVLLDGPQGCGKTVLSRRIAEILGLEYVFFNCAGIYEATDFLASLQIKAGEGGQAETVWTPTDIRRALEAANSDPKRRFLIFLDEFNRCRELARNGIMPALDSTRRLFDPITGSTLSIPGNVQWIAAINNGAQFTGTTNVDPAQLDRFATIKMAYPPEEAEVRILQERHPTVPLAVATAVVRLANEVRKHPALGVDLSMRATEEACILLSHPNFSEAPAASLPKVVRTSFCGRFQGTPEDESSDAGMVWKVLADALAKGAGSK